MFYNFSFIIEEKNRYVHNRKDFYSVYHLKYI